MPARGWRGAYRPIPADFEERWPQFGWGAAAKEWQAHPRSIEAWLEALGKDRMAARRAAYREMQRQVKNRARRKSYRVPGGVDGGTEPDDIEQP
jgi:hypothetical protein